MFHAATHHNGLRRPRFGITEVLLIVGILAFGGFTLVDEGRQTLETLLAGVEDVVRG
jgi:hypothetical protein